MNIRTIAKMCNVSIATVSRVLHGSSKVSNETRSRVIHTIHQYGYLPNPLAQGLIKKRTWLIGVLVPDLYNQFVPTVVAPFSQVMEKFRYQCILNATKNDPQKEYEAINKTLRYYCEAIVFVGTRLKEDKNRDYIQEIGEKLPVIMINALEAIENTYHVYNDECVAVESVVDYLIVQGRRNLALIVGDVGQNTFCEKKKGFIQGLRKNGLEPEAGCILEGYGDYDDYRQPVEQLFHRPQPPDAIITGGDLPALGVLKNLTRMHIGVPEEVMLVGYDNIPFAELSVPGLTTVDQQGAILGKTAAEVLLKVLNGEEIHRQHRFLPQIYRRETA